jgi:HAD superfamily hydrolase (TIGR01509 family)
MHARKKEMAVIFDCDGVMFDSKQANINFYNHLLSRYGLPLMTKEEIAFVHAHTAEESVRHIFKGSPHTDKAQAYRLTVDYRPFISDMIIQPGLVDVLKKLKTDYGLAVATNRSNTIGGVLQHFGLSRFFDIVVSSLDVQQPKPHPESIYKILDFFDLPPGRSCYIGDSKIDSQTAKAAGICFIAFKDADLEAQYHIDHLHKITDIVRHIMAQETQ